MGWSDPRMLRRASATVRPRRSRSAGTNTTRPAISRPTTKATANHIALAAVADAETGRPERDPPGDQRGHETKQPARNSDDKRLNDGELPNPPLRQTTSAQQRLLIAPPAGAGSNQSGCQQRGEHSARQPEEQKQHLGVRGIAARSVERGGHIVADQRGPSQLRLEVTACSDGGFVCSFGT